jgi:hypothetical protein
MCISISVCILFLARCFLDSSYEETKNTWARDDPAILILMAGGMFGEFLVFSTLSRFSTSHARSCGHSLVSSLVLWPIRYHSIGVSYGIPRFPFRGRHSSHLAVVRSTSRTCHLRFPFNRFYRLFANRALLSPPSHSTPADTAVEWAYAFDVHTNAFFPLYLTLYVAQLPLVSVILKKNWVCLWVGNTFYLVA